MDAYRSGTIIRAATPADAPAIAGVHVAAWQAAYTGLLPAAYLNSLRAEQRQNMWEQILTQTIAGVAVCVPEGQVQGFVSYGPARGEDEQMLVAGEIYAIYLLPGQWGKGYGRQLMDHATAAMWANGYRTVILWVLRANTRAIRFYRQYGFLEDGGQKQERLGDGTLMDEIRYRLDLE